MLRHRLGFRWVDIATILGISSRTLSRRRQEFGMPVGQNYNFSSISSDELDGLVVVSIQGRRYWGGVGGCNTPPNNFKLEKLVKLEKKLVKIYNWSKYIIGHF